MIDPTMQDGNAPFDGDTFWAGYEDTWAPFDEPPSSSSSTGGGGGGSKGSKGSKGGYKYPPPPADNCDCEIKESVVPAGGAEASEGPALLGSKTRTLKFKWTEAEPLDSVPPNLPRHFYSRVTANWSVKKCEENCEGGSQVSGSYDFIFKGLVQPSTGEKLKTDLNITLSPKHGSHQGADNKMPPWPIFDGMTPEQRKDQWAKNVYESFQSKCTSGEVSLTVEYREYGNAWPEIFNPAVAARDYGGPCESPTDLEMPPGQLGGQPPGSRFLYIPNRVRWNFREIYPWMQGGTESWNSQPIWSQAPPTVTYRWWLEKKPK